MALPTISPADFVGQLRLTQNRFKNEDFENFISELYPEIIQNLLGDFVLNDMQALDPLPAKYTDLLQGSGVYFNSILDYTKSKPKLLDVVKAFIYLHWVRSFQTNTPAGDVRNMSENAVNLTRAEIEGAAKIRYNRAVDNFNKFVYPFLCNYEKVTGTISSITDLGGGFIRIFSASTLYLLEGDIVKINGADYTVANLVNDVSFDIEAPLISANEYIYEPFKYAIFDIIDPIL